MKKYRLIIVLAAVCLLALGCSQSRYDSNGKLKIATPPTENTR